MDRLFMLEPRTIGKRRNIPYHKESTKRLYLIDAFLMKKSLRQEQRGRWKNSGKEPAAGDAGGPFLHSDAAVVD